MVIPRVDISKSYALFTVTFTFEPGNMVLGFVSFISMEIFHNHFYGKECFGPYTKGLNGRANGLTDNAKNNITILDTYLKNTLTRKLFPQIYSAVITDLYYMSTRVEKWVHIK